MFFGYWAWEVVPLVKIQRIDDTDLKNQKNDPYNALHWNL
ncbi:PoNe immunity protein domain-containing protein [Flavobacterium sp. NKUCC04_CG]|nr:DUF1911 domain-containing protein [Flavobacterium sp. NKUCC04_CG]